MGVAGVCCMVYWWLALFSHSNIDNKISMFRCFIYLLFIYVFVFSVFHVVGVHWSQNLFSLQSKNMLVKAKL